MIVLVTYISLISRYFTAIPSNRKTVWKLQSFPRCKKPISLYTLMFRKQQTYKLIVAYQETTFTFVSVMCSHLLLVTHQRSNPDAGAPVVQTLMAFQRCMKWRATSRAAAPTTIVPTSCHGMRGVVLRSTRSAKKHVKQLIKWFSNSPDFHNFWIVPHLDTAGPSWQSPSQ